MAHRPRNCTTCQKSPPELYGLSLHEEIHEASGRDPARGHLPQLPLKPNATKDEPQVAEEMAGASLHVLQEGASTTGAQLPRVGALGRVPLQDEPSNTMS